VDGRAQAVRPAVLDASATDRRACAPHGMKATEPG
jgi:hypothetical protein